MLFLYRGCGFCRMMADVHSPPKDFLMAPWHAEEAHRQAAASIPYSICKKRRYDRRVLCFIDDEATVDVNVDSISNVGSDDICS